LCGSIENSVVAWLRTHFELEDEEIILRNKKTENFDQLINTTRSGEYLLYMAYAQSQLCPSTSEETDEVFVGVPILFKVSSLAHS